MIKFPSLCPGLHIFMLCSTFKIGNSSFNSKDRNDFPQDTVHFFIQEVFTDYVVL